MRIPLCTENAVLPVFRLSKYYWTRKCLQQSKVHSPTSCLLAYDTLKRKAWNPILGASDEKGRVDLSKLKLALVRFGIDPKDMRQLHAMGFEVTMPYPVYPLCLCVCLIQYGLNVKCDPILIASGCFEVAKVHKIQRPICVDQLDEPAHRTTWDRLRSRHLPRVDAITCSHCSSVINRFRQRNAWSCAIKFNHGREPRSSWKQRSFLKSRARYLHWDCSSCRLRRRRNSVGWRWCTRFYADQRISAVVIWYESRVF